MAFRTYIEQESDIDHRFLFKTSYAKKMSRRRLFIQNLQELLENTIGIFEGVGISYKFEFERNPYARWLAFQQLMAFLRAKEMGYPEVAKDHCSNSSNKNPDTLEPKSSPGRT